MTRVSVAFLIAICGGPVLASEKSVDRLLSYVPVDAGLVFAVRDAAGVGERLSAFGVAAEIRPLAKADSRRFLRELHVFGETAGLDTLGPFVIAYGPSHVGPIAACYVDNVQAWQAAVGAKPAEEGLYRTEALGEFTRASLQGDVLVVGPEEALHGLSAAGGVRAKFQAAAGALMERNDACVYVRVPAWQPLIRTGLLTLRASMQMSMQASGQDPVASQNFANWLSDTLSVLVEDLDAFVVGGRVDGERVLLEGRWAFRPGSQVAEYLAGIQPTDRDLLRGLHTHPGWMAFGCEWQLPPDAMRLDVCWMKSMLEFGTRDTPRDQAEFEKILRVAQEMSARASGYNMAVLAQPCGTRWTSAGYYFSDKPQRLLDSMQQMYQYSPALMRAYGGPGTSMQIEVAEEDLAGRRAHVYTMRFQVEDEHTRRMLQAMYGDKLTSIFTSHAEGVVYAMGPADEARQLLLELITKTDAARTPDARVAGAVQRLSPRPQVVMLLDLPQMFTFSLGMARAMGLPVPPVDLPREAGDLIAAGLYLDDGAIRSELSIPADPIRRTVQAVRAAKARER